MNSIPEPSIDNAEMTALLERCAQLCQTADTTLTKLAAESDSFLASSLGDALQQLELILRALEQEANSEAHPDGASAADEETKGFLSRIFGRKEEAATSVETTETPAPQPNIDVAMQGLQGNSWTFSLAELLGFLAYGRKSGVLWVDAPDENYLLVLADGHLMHATSNKTPEGLRLGEILVGLGYLTRRQLERFLSRLPEGAANVSGEELLSSGMISDDELRNALAYQVQQLFHRLVGTRNAVFRFREGMQVMLAYQIRLDINHLLLDTARHQDEVVGSTERTQAIQADWNSWQNELSTRLTTNQQETAAPEVSNGAQAEAAASSDEVQDTVEETRSESPSEPESSDASDAQETRAATATEDAATDEESAESAESTSTDNRDDESDEDGEASNDEESNSADTSDSNSNDGNGSQGSRRRGKRRRNRNGR